jgi:hypothetical protein
MHVCIFALGLKVEVVRKQIQTVYLGYLLYPSDLYEFRGATPQLSDFFMFNKAVKLLVLTWLGILIEYN